MVLQLDIYEKELKIASEKFRKGGVLKFVAKFCSQNKFRSKISTNLAWIRDLVL